LCNLLKELYLCCYDIFKRFVRANDYAGGFGVGMNIIKSIADEYGFAVEIDSKEGKGTKIVIRW